MVVLADRTPLATGHLRQVFEHPENSRYLIKVMRPDAVVSRWLDRTRQTIHQPLYRQFFGRCFNWITRRVMGLPFKDTQCGFKAFKRESAQVIFRLQTIERWGFDPEILFIARKLKYMIREVPVTWGHDERSRMSYLKDGMKMLEDMAVIRGNGNGRS